MLSRPARQILSPISYVSFTSKKKHTAGGTLTSCVSDTVYFHNLGRNLHMTLRATLVLVLAGALLTGCATTVPFRSAPDLKQKTTAMQSVSVLPAKVDVYELGMATREKIDDWSDQARTNIVQSLRKQIARYNDASIRFYVVDSTSTEQKAMLEDTETLYDAVDASIVLHTYTDKNIFQDKIKGFDYSLGPEVATLKDSADVYLIVRAWDEISSGGRKAAQAGAAIVGALFGFSVATPGGITRISIALVDPKDGAILWHAYLAKEGTYDLRDVTSTDKLVENVFKNFPLAKAKK